MTTPLTRNDPVVFHFRKGTGKDMQPKGGATVVFLPEHGRFGIALCCDKDRYCRQWGRKIATERAKNGERSRIRNRRFNSAPKYTGPLEMEAVRLQTISLIANAAEAVGNDLVWEVATEYGHSVWADDVNTEPENPIEEIQTKVIEAQVVETIRTIFDPEIPVNIYDMGLIYKIDVLNDSEVNIEMTLTSPACPVAGSLPGDVERKVAAMAGVSEAKVELVWEPTWNPDMMTEAAKLQLNM